jgi:translation initiation factor 2-alpha kinase 4
VRLYMLSFQVLAIAKFVLRRVASISPALQQHVTNMIMPTKKTHVSCLGLLADLSDMSLHNGTTQQGRARSQSIAVSGPKTPRVSAAANNYSSSPEKEYFVAPQRTRQASRWKEDWEELEMLVRLSHLSFMHTLTRAAS